MSGKILPFRHMTKQRKAKAADPAFRYLGGVVDNWKPEASQGQFIAAIVIGAIGGSIILFSVLSIIELLK